MKTFKVGDRVFATDMFCEGFGTVRAIDDDGNYPDPGLPICVIMETTNPYTHDCDGLAPDKDGRFFNASSLTIAAPLQIDTASIAEYYHAVVSYTKNADQL